MEVGKTYFLHVNYIGIAIIVFRSRPSQKNASRLKSIQHNCFLAGGRQRHHSIHEVQGEPGVHGGDAGGAVPPDAAGGQLRHVDDGGRGAWSVALHVSATGENCLIAQYKRGTN